MTIKRGEELLAEMKAGQIVGLDGLPSSESNENRLNELIGRLFTLDPFLGEQAIAYMKRITVNRIMPAGTPGDVLQHMEGQRWFVGVLQNRLDAFRKGPPAKPTLRGKIGRKKNVQV